MGVGQKFDPIYKKCRFRNFFSIPVTLSNILPKYSKKSPFFIYSEFMVLSIYLIDTKLY